MSSNEWPTPVVYLGGSGRSGSTLLADVLGEAPGFVSVGELRFLWQRGVVQNRLCGCGRRFSDCAFWIDVLDITFGPTTAAERVAMATRLHADLKARTRLRTLPRHLRRRPREVTPLPDELEDVLGRLYPAIAAVARADVVVDSSTLPTYAAVLHGLDEIDLRVAHFLRDPRAAVYSWRRRRAQPDLGPGAVTPRRGAGRSALLWAIWNRALEMLLADHPQSYTRVTYEEFLREPRRVAEDVLDALDVPGDLGPVFAGPTTVRMGVRHTVAGNPARHQHGLVPLVADLEWQDRMSTTDRNAVAALTWPARRRYGYRLRN